MSRRLLPSALPACGSLRGTRRCRPSCRWESLALACAVGLAACAGPGEPEAPPAAPTAAAAPLSPERERFEHFKQDAATGDPRVAFAHQAEAEASLRRSEALARGVGPAPGAVEAELVEDRLLEWSAGDGSCFEEEPDLSGQDDWIRHRKLAREDFLAPQQRPPAKPSVGTSDGEVGAYVVIRFACVVKGRLSEPEPGHFVMTTGRVEYLALLSRLRSWWNPELESDEWVLRHEQLHFDVAELIAHELTAQAGDAAAKLRGVGPDPQAAKEDFRSRWAAHMRTEQESFRQIEQAYDRETRNGHDIARQTEWFARVTRGLGAVRAGLDAPPVLTP